VGDEPERLGEIPGGEGVGGEARVDHRDGADEVGVVEVVVEARELLGQQEALVDDGLGRQRGHVEAAVGIDARAAHPVLHQLPDDEELALEGAGHDPAAGDVHLPHHRHHLARQRTELRWIDWHVTPAQQPLVLLVDDLGEDPLALGASEGIGREEHLPHAVAQRRGHVEAQLEAFAVKETMRELREDAGAIASQGIGPGGAAVLHALEHLEALLDDRSRRLSFDVGDEAHPAAVMLGLRLVQPPTVWLLHVVLPRGLSRKRQMIVQRVSPVKSLPHRSLKGPQRLSQGAGGRCEGL